MKKIILIIKRIKILEKCMQTVIKDNTPSIFSTHVINSLENSMQNSNLAINLSNKLPIDQQTNKNETYKNISQNTKNNCLLITKIRLLQTKNLGNKSIVNFTNTKNLTKLSPNNSLQSGVVSERGLISDLPSILPSVIGDAVDTTVGLGTSILGTAVSTVSSVVKTTLNAVDLGFRIAASFITNPSYVCEGPTKPRIIITPPLPPINMSYADYVTKYKPDGVDARDPYRQSVYANNLNKINSHNLLTTRTYDMGLNSFSDLSDSQFRAQYFGLVIPPKNLNAVTPYANYTEPRKIKIDWGCKCGIILTQGSCGSCYAIAALESIQITMRIYNLSTSAFSIQQILSCGSNGGDLNGCKGGYFKAVFDYVQMNGVAGENAYPYQPNTRVLGSVSACSLKKTPNGGQSKIKIRNSVLIPYGDCFTLVEQLQQRAIAVAIVADGLQLYVQGTYTTDKTTVNHGVTLVGYDPNRGYKIKNSWTSTWGNNGYAYVDNSSGICNFAMYPQLVTEAVTPQNCC